MGDVKVGIPLLLSSLRQTDHFRQEIRHKISYCVKFEAEGTDRMVNLLQLETERLLNNNEMGASEREALDEFCGMIRGEETTVGKQQKVGRVIIPDFEWFFCNEFIFIPDCLVNALDQNKEFNHEAALLRESLEKSIYDVLSCSSLQISSDEELEAVIRSYPGLLNTNLDEALAHNKVTIDFIPLMAKLGLEHGVDVRKKIEDAFEWYLDPGASVNWYGWVNVKYEDMMDDLRSMNLFFKEDIEKYHLIDKLMYRFCCKGWSERHILRFRYLVNWNPIPLTREQYNCPERNLPLHRSLSKVDDLSAFSCVLELGLKHFPNKFGFLFHMNKDGLTPLAMARGKYGAEKVNKVVASLLSTGNGTANKSLESLFVSLAIDESVHWEGVYIVLRRDPSVLARVLKAKGHGNRKRKRKKEKRRDSK